MRKTSQELEAIKKKYRVSKLWSWSRYNCYKTSPFEYLLKYILNTPEDRRSIYNISGNGCHNIIEKFYTKEIKFEDMLPSYEEELFQYNLAELKYDRNNEEKNKNIAEKYEYCLRHFFRNHQPIPYKVDLERFILIWIGNQLMQGYIDCIHKEKDVFVITDWKSSSIYKGQKIDKEKGQLILYCEGLHQLGVPLENIKIRWNFLKYVSVEIQQANGKTTIREIARNEIGESLKANVKMWLKKTKKYTEEQIDEYLDLLVEINDISCLPDEIQSKYIINDCYVYIPFNQEEIDKLKIDIMHTIIEINLREMQYIQTKDESIFWEEVTDENSYYFSNLCGFSGRLHKPYGEYLDKLKLRNDNYNKNKVEDEDDLSWMLDL